jgi:hypothetical protein
MTVIRTYEQDRPRLTDRARPLVFDVGGTVPAHGSLVLDVVTPEATNVEMIDILPKPDIWLARALVNEESQMFGDPVPADAVSNQPIHFTAGVRYRFELASRCRGRRRRSVRYAPGVEHPRH